MAESRQDMALAIVPKIGASISMPCSAFIIYEAVCDHRRGRGTAIQRALVGMSVVDICASSAWWLSTWALPEGTAPFAAGNMASCNFQGFLLQLAVGAPLYNCSLALFYLLVIKYNWSNQQLVKIERFVHSLVIIFSVGTSIAGLPLTMYNKVGSVCWVIGSPDQCGNSSATPTDVPCDRGDWAWVFGIALFYGPLWICVLLNIAAMLLIYHHVRKTFQKARRYTYDGIAPTQNRNSMSISMDGTLSRFSVFRPSGQLFVSEPAGERPKSLQEAVLEVQASIKQSDIDEGYDEDGNDDADIRRVSQAEINEGGDTREMTSSGRSKAKNKSAWYAVSRMVTASNTAEERRMRREKRRRSKQTLFAIQAVLYGLSFVITWAPSTIWSIAHWFNVGGFGLDMAAAVCEPLQGFWNMLIFIRTRKSSQDKVKRIFCGFLCCISFCPKFWSTSSSQEDLSSAHLDMSSRKSSHAKQRTSVEVQRESQQRNSMLDSIQAEEDSDDEDGKHVGGSLRSLRSDNSCKLSKEQPNFDTDLSDALTPERESSPCRA